MDFGSENESDTESFSEFADYPSIVNAKRNWKKLYQIVLDKRSEIPLK